MTTKSNDTCRGLGLGSDRPSNFPFPLAVACIASPVLLRLSLVLLN